MAVKPPKKPFTRHSKPPCELLVEIMSKFSSANCAGSPPPQRKCLKFVKKPPLTGRMNTGPVSARCEELVEIVQD